MDWPRRAMTADFKVGDHVRWNSEAGRVSGVIIKKIPSDTKFKGYVHHASREAPNISSKAIKRSMSPFTKAQHFGWSRPEPESRVDPKGGKGDSEQWNRPNLHD